MENLKKLSWKLAATGGMILGLVFIFIMIIGYAQNLEKSYSWITGVTEFIALVIITYIYAKKMADAYGNEGFTYGQSVGFILKMMLCAGVFAGIGQYVLYNYIDPDYYQEMMELALLNQGMSNVMIAENMDAILRMVTSPIFMVLGGMFGMVLYGGLIGIFVSAFVKKPAKPFSKNNSQD